MRDRLLSCCVGHCADSAVYVTGERLVTWFCVPVCATEPELRQAAEFGRLKLACPRGKGARLAAKGAQIDWYLNGRQLLLTKPAGTLQPEFFTEDSRLKLKSNR